MNKNKTLLIIGFFSFCITTNTWAATAEASPSTTTPNILKGNWYGSGGLSFTKNAGRKSDASEYVVSLSGSYFLIDHLALGLTLGVDGETNQNTVAALGPSATYFFWSTSTIATYVGTGFRLGLPDATVDSIMQLRMGLEYFLTSSVAIGPSAFYYYYNSKSGDYKKYGLLLSLSTYL